MKWKIPRSKMALEILVLHNFPISDYKMENGTRLRIFIFDYQVRLEKKYSFGRFAHLTSRGHTRVFITNKISLTTAQPKPAN